MAGNLKLERIGVVLALLMGAGALLLELDQRRSAGPTGEPAPAPTDTTLAPLPPTVTVDGKIVPYPVPPDGKEIRGKGGELPRMQGIQDGRKLYELSAERLILTQGDRLNGAEGSRGAGVFGKDGKPSLRFTAERAIMDTATKDLKIEGAVHVESLDPNNKVTFETRDMEWKAREEQLICPNPVEVTQPGAVLRGSRMTADVRLKKLHLEGGIYLEADVERVQKTLGVGNAAGAAKGGR
ncbi:MAG: LPS export ABC transporter periplasmic protein LptC [Armatimonadetes bacterium]|nr:LPS export ABC transporter periplasmic protein LptC [Armatimonadota bacterium]